MHKTVFLQIQLATVLSFQKTHTKVTSQKIVPVLDTMRFRHKASTAESSHEPAAGIPPPWWAHVALAASDPKAWVPY